MNFLLEDLQEVSDVEIRNSTNALLEKLRFQLKKIDEKLENAKINSDENEIYEDDINLIEQEQENAEVTEEIEEEEDARL